MYKKKAILIILIILILLGILAVPIVLNNDKDSEKESAEKSAINIKEAGELYYEEEMIKGNTPINIDLTSDTLSYDGEKPDKGTIIYDDNGKTNIKVYINGYCVKVDYDNTVTSEKMDSDECITELVVLTLNPNGGDLSETSKNYISGDTLGTLPSPTRLDNTFTGWTLVDGTKVTKETIITENMEVIATWKVDNYTVTFDPNGGSKVSSINVEYNSAYGVLPTTTRTGYIFNG